jgi:small subunit ribosomal protein S16
MLKIRLQRVGRKNDPAFRVVVVNSLQGIKSKKAVEQVGFYNPKSKERSLDAERIKYWIEHGAQPSDTMHNMLVSEKIIEGTKRNVLPQKSPVVKEGGEAEAPASPKKEEIPEVPTEVAEVATSEKEEVAPVGVDIETQGGQSIAEAEVAEAPEETLEVPEEAPAPTPEEKVETSKESVEQKEA